MSIVTTTQAPELVNGKIVVTFSGGDTFEAMYAAEAWCRERDISYGSWQRGFPAGLLYGDFTIAKWRNLTPKEQSECHGTMRGDGRNGPITISIKPRRKSAPPEP